MMIDYSQIDPAGGVIVFPDWAVEAQPVQPDQVNEVVYLRATADGALLLGGSTDDPN